MGQKLKLFDSGIQNIQMESTAGKEDDLTKRLDNHYDQQASFAGANGMPSIGFGNDKLHEDSMLSRWVHKERTSNGTASFKAHFEDEP